MFNSTESLSFLCSYKAYWSDSGIKFLGRNNCSSKDIKNTLVTIDSPFSRRYKWVN